MDCIGTDIRSEQFARWRHKHDIRGPAVTVIVAQFMRGKAVRVSSTKP
jgi:hypothetical protein